MHQKSRKKIMPLMVIAVALAIIINYTIAGTLSTSPGYLSVSNSKVDVGQTSVINTTISGGSGSYTGQWIITSANMTDTFSGTRAFKNIPSRVLFGSSGGFAYVDGTCGTSPSYNYCTLLLNTSSNKVVRTIFNKPILGINPSNTFAYLNYNSTTVSVVSLATNETINNISISVSAYAQLQGSAVFDPSGNLAYILTTGNAIMVINAATNTMVGNVIGFNDPTSAAFSPSGTLAYVVNHNSSTVSVVDVAANTIVNTIAINGATESIVLNPSGTFAYVNNALGVDIISTASNSIVNTITGCKGSDWLAFNPSTNLLYAGYCNSYRDVGVLSLTSNSEVNSIEVGDLTYNPITINPSGTLAYTPIGYSSDGGGGLAVINLTTNELQHNYNAGTSSLRGIAMSPDGALMAFASSSGGMSIVNTITNSITLIPSSQFKAGTSLTPASYGAAFSPDGSTVYVNGQVSSSNDWYCFLYVLDISSGTVTANIPLGDQSTPGLCGVASLSQVADNPSGTRSVIINPSGTTAYVAVPNLEEISVVNLGTDTVTKNIALNCSQPGGLIGAGGVLYGGSSIENLAEKGNLLYVPCPLNGGGIGGTVAVVNVSSELQVNAVVVGNSLGTDIAADPSFPIVYVSNSSGITVINTTSNKAVDYMNMGNSGISSIMFNPSGTLAYVAMYYQYYGVGYWLRVIDVATGKTLGTIYTSNSTEDMINSPISNSVAYASISGGTYASLNTSVLSTDSQSIPSNGLMQLTFDPFNASAFKYTFNGVMHQKSVAGSTIGRYSFYSLVNDGSGSTSNSYNSLYLNYFGGNILFTSSLNTPVFSGQDQNFTVNATFNVNGINTTGFPFPYRIEYYNGAPYMAYNGPYNSFKFSYLLYAPNGTVVSNAIYYINLGYLTGYLTGSNSVLVSGGINYGYQTSPSFSFRQNASWGVGQFTANLSILDNATTPFSLSKSLTYNAYFPVAATPLPSSPPSSISLSNQTVLLGNGNTVYANSVISKGTGSPYYGQWALIKSSTGGSVPINSSVTASTEPYDITFSPSGATAYVSIASPPLIDVINVSTNTIVARINTGSSSYPEGMAVNPSGTLLYIASCGSKYGELLIANTTTNKVIDTIITNSTGSSCPQKVTFNPSGKYAYVMDYDRFIYVINVTSSTIVKRIGKASGTPLCGPYDARVSPGGSTAYITDSCEYGNVIFLNTSTDTITKEIDVGGSYSYFYGLALSPDGSKLYIANCGYPANIMVMNTSTGTIVGNAFLGDSACPYGVALSPSGKYAYTTDQYSSYGNTVQVINLSTLNVTENITVSYGAYPYFLEANPQGLLYVPGFYRPNVSVIDTATNKVINTINTSVIGYAPYNETNTISLTGITPSQILFSNDGKSAYVTFRYNANSTSGLDVINSTTEKVTKTISLGTNVIDSSLTYSPVAIDPSGSLVYVGACNEVYTTVGSTYTYTGSGNIIVVDSSSGSIINSIYINNDLCTSGVAFNPSGTLAYAINSSVYTLASGSYFYNSVVSNTIDIIDVATNTVTGIIRPVPVTSSITNIAFSPSGKSAYVYANGNVLVINTSTNAIINSIPESAGTISFSPDGSKAYVAQCQRLGVINTTSSTSMGVLNESYGSSGCSYGLGFDPSGTLAYVSYTPSSSSTDANISIIDTLAYDTTSAIISKINVGDTDGVFAANPTGNTLYVYNNGTDSISVIRQPQVFVSTSLQQLPTVQTSNGLMSLIIKSTSENTLSVDFNGNTITQSFTSNLLGDYALYGYGKDNTDPNLQDTVFVSNSLSVCQTPATCAASTSITSTTTSIATTAPTTIASVTTTIANGGGSSGAGGVSSYPTVTQLQNSCILITNVTVNSTINFVSQGNNFTLHVSNIGPDYTCLNVNSNTVGLYYEESRTLVYLTSGISVNQNNATALPICPSVSSNALATS